MAVEVLTRPSHPICYAYTQDGRLCRKPAVYYDRKGGYMVCGAHVRPGRLGEYVRRDEAKTPETHELGGES